MTSFVKRDHDEKHEAIAARCEKAFCQVLFIAIKKKKKKKRRKVVLNILWFQAG